ncbi:MAG: hypothetical protein MZU97_05825 [Bacillus subtilis]|nr:hypothetical protein [Bacillus subtilis]
MQKTIEQLSIGETATLTKTFFEADVLGFATVSGDFNPAHVDEAYAKTTIFQIAHRSRVSGWKSV